MASSINASTSAGLVTSADTSGDLNIQSGGSTKIAVTSAGVAVTGLSKASLPTGSVLQVVNTSNTTTYTTSTNAYISLGLSLSITPTSATSKILVLCSIASTGKETGNTYAAFRLDKNGSSLQTNIGLYGGRTASTALNYSAGTSFHYLDSPATTSSTTYEIKMNSDDNLASVYANGFKSITLMEIAA